MYNRGKAEGENKGSAKAVLNLMETMGLDLETAMAALKIDGVDRPAIRKLVEEMLRGMPA